MKKVRKINQVKEEIKEDKNKEKLNIRDHKQIADRSFTLLLRKNNCN